MYIVFEPGVLSGIFSALAYLLNACFLGVSLVKPCFLGFVAYLLSICFLSVCLMGIWFSLGVPFCLLCILCILGVAVSQLDYTGQVHWCSDVQKHLEISNSLLEAYFEWISNEYLTIYVNILIWMMGNNNWFLPKIIFSYILIHIVVFMRGLVDQPSTRFHHWSIQSKFKTCKFTRMHIYEQIFF